MSKEIDEIKEKIARRLHVLDKNLRPEFLIWTNLTAKDKQYFYDVADQILSIETPTHRLAIVRKKPELPIVRDTKQAILDAGFVQEEKE